MTAGKFGGFGVTGVRPNRPTRCSVDLSNTPIAPAMKGLVFTVIEENPKGSRTINLRSTPLELRKQIKLRTGDRVMNFIYNRTSSKQINERNLISSLVAVTSVALHFELQLVPNN